MIANWKKSADIYLRCLVISPAILLIHWSMAFFLYFVILAYCFWTLIFKGKQRSEVPLWLMVQAIALVFLAINYSGEMPTLLNLGALFATNVMYMTLMYCLPNTQESMVYFFLGLRKYLFYLAGFGIVASTFLSPILHIDNPIVDVLTGNRMRIFSMHVGHTAVIECGVVTFFITLAFFDMRKFRRDLIYIFAGLFLVYFARTAQGYVGIVASFLVWLIEKSRMGFLYKNIIYAILVPAALFAYLNYGDQLLLSVRTFQVGSQAANSGGNDLSSGRSDLNYYLGRVIEQHPWLGDGVTNKIVENGIVDTGGHEIAKVESPLRMGAKYGAPYLALMFILCIYSSLVLLMVDVRFRIIGLSLALYNLDGFFGNGLFETPQSWNSFLLVFPTVLIGEYARRSRKKVPVAQARYRPSFAQNGAPRYGA